MRNFYQYLFVALLGGFGYCFVEILWRGRTHYSMFFAGAIVLSCFYFINDNYNLPFALKCVLGMAVITAVELVFGIVFNLILREQVWDYSNMPLNLFGQICLPFSALWFLLSGVVFKAMEEIERMTA